MCMTIFGFFGMTLPQKENVGDTIRIGRWICKVIARIGKWHLLRKI